VIALRRAAGDKCAGTLGQRGSARPLQLADLVASTAQAAEIIAFEPQVARIETERPSQLWPSFEWRWPGGKANWLHRYNTPPF
jgi:hypothetical protein